MNVIARETVVQEGNIKPSHSLAQFHPIGVSVSGELEEELAIMTAVGEVIYLSGDEVTVGSGHSDELSVNRDHLQ